MTLDELFEKIDNLPSDSCGCKIWTEKLAWGYGMLSIGEHNEERS